MAFAFIVGAPAPTAPVSASGLAWPVKNPGETRRYGLDVTTEVGNDPIISYAVRIAPSGTGELAVNALSTVGKVLYLDLTAGVGGRSYEIDVTITLMSGDVVELVGLLAMNPELIPVPYTEPPSTGYGSTTTWPFIPALNFAQALDSQYLTII